MPAKVAETRRFKVGETIMARWPKTNLFFEGEILDFNDIEYLIRINDEDKSEIAVKYKDVQAPFKRSRSRSLGRTPTKPRKSPSRKSPARKSPSRKSPGRPARKKEEAGSSSEKVIKNEKTKEVTAVVQNESPTPKSETHISHTNVTTERQSARIASIEKKSFLDEKSNSTIPSNSIKVDAEKVVKSIQEKSKVLELLKRLVLCTWMSIKPLPLAISVTALPFVLNMLCTVKKCEIRVPETRPKLLSFYDQKAFLILGGLFVSLLILTLVPIGKVVRTKTGAKIRCNGYISLIFIGITMAVLLKMEYNLASIYGLYRPFMAGICIVGMLMSLLLYIKSFFSKRDALNPKATTGYYLYDFMYGREISPRIGSFDLKFFFFRVCIICTILLNCVIVTKDLQAKNGVYSLTLLVSAGMQVFYALDLILFEDAYVTTYGYMNEGLGFISCVAVLSIPFYFTLFTRFALNHRPELPWYCLMGIGALYLLGYTVLRASNSQKHAFRTNPADPALVHLESLPTSAGKRLLVSGWWGFVRHPNYLGGALVQTSWALLCGFNHAIPWLVLGCSLQYLLLRMFTVEKHCKAKYGLAWTSYTSRVPYRILPKVF